jgi:CRP-like cAMP-binding protein
MVISATSLVERNTLFRGLPRSITEHVASLAVRRVYEKDSIVFLQGDPGDALYLVVRGGVRISVSRAGGKEVFLNIMQPGDAFGEIGLLDGNPRTATATTTARSELLIIGRNRFLSLLSNEPRLAAHLIQLLCARLRWTAAQSEDAALLAVPARLAKRLLSLARVHGRETSSGTRLVLSQEQLAQFLGISRQIVNQHLRAWKVKGWVTVGRGSVAILNARSLQNLTHQ